MIPLPLILSLATAMSTGTPTPEAHVVIGHIHWRARWLGGGKLVALGYPGVAPTDTQLREEDPTRVDELCAEGREVIEAAMQRRAWRMARARGAVVRWASVVAEA